MALAAVVAFAVPALAAFPYPPPPAGTDPNAYEDYAFTGGERPDDFGSDWIFTSDKTGFPEVDSNPQELYGVQGASLDLAWKITTGRPDVLIAVLDSGINWPDPLNDHRNKTFINRGELPLPAGSADYDADDNGTFDMRDYGSDAAVTDQNGNLVKDPEDLILIFSDGVDDDANGYVDDISGWDFFEHDNNPRDEVRYGHGTGEAEDSTAEANNGGDLGTCPNCMFVPLRVGDSFIADVNEFAQAVVYATDNGISVIQEALGTLNNSAMAQQAIDDAWEHGVIVAASAADEAAGHHNYPSSYARTLVLNSVTRSPDEGGFNLFYPRSNLFLNGCTNFGAHISVSVPSDSCSSEATGRGAGMLGLIYSAARNLKAKGFLTDYPGPITSVLSANEVKQLVQQTADDIDFLSPGLNPAANVLAGELPLGPPANYAVAGPVPTKRYPSLPGFDQYFGYGRISPLRALERLAQMETCACLTVPPEAEITSPAWFDTLDTAPFPIEGRVAAVRAVAAGGTYSYKVEIAPGVQPLDAAFKTVAAEISQTIPTSGTLATVDPAEFAALLAAADASTPAANAAGKLDPDRFGFTIRVRVKDSFGNVGEDRREIFIHHDPDLLGGFPVDLGADGANSPAFADLNGDGDELILGTSNGEVHAFTWSGSAPVELAGWPVQTAALAGLNAGAPGYASGAVEPAHEAVLVGSVAVADLDKDGTREVIAADIGGHVWAWEPSGSVRSGFPVEINQTYCGAGDGVETFARNRDNRIDCGFVAQPAVGDLDGNDGGDLEIVVGGLDRHVYAFNDDGTPVPGWPVLLADPAKVLSVDATTHQIAYTEDSGVQIGSKIIVTPTLGDLDGDGTLEVVIARNEEYVETPDASFASSPLPGILKQSGLTDPGNARLYALHHDGRLHAAHDGSGTSAHPDDQAYVSGWPAKVPLVTTELLPYVGTGMNGPAPLADIDGDGTLEVGAFGFAGPATIFRADGSPFYGRDPDGRAITLSDAVPGALANGHDVPTLPSLGGGTFGDLTGTGRINLVAPGAGLMKLLDVVFPAQQFLAETHVLAWDLTTRQFLPGFPHQTVDLQFLNTPSIADVNGDGLPEILEGSATEDFHAVNVLGVEPPGWPKHTGGWTVTTAAVGDFDGDGVRDVADVTREGKLFVWRTTARACDPAPWPKHNHDLENSGNLSHPSDVEPCGPPSVPMSLPLAMLGALGPIVVRRGARRHVE